MSKKAPQPAASRGLFVLGMHRSGTSALTRVLNLRGLHLGSDLLQGRADNVSGHWESLRVIELNERLLAALGRSWSDPREMPEGWMGGESVATLLPEAALLLQQEYLSHAHWAIKDPRVSRLFPFWARALADAGGVQPAAVIAVRHPWEVASSLNRRDGITLSQGMLLWLQHTREALASSQGLKRAVLHYPQLLEDWRGELGRLGDALGLPLLPDRQDDKSTKDIESFLSPEARNERFAEGASRVPSVLAGIFEALCAATDECALQVVGATLDQLVGSARVHAMALADVQVHRMRLQERVGELETAYADAGRRREDELQGMLDGITKHLAHADWVNGEMERRWQAAMAELQLAVRHGEQKDQHIESLLGQLSAAIAEQDRLHGELELARAEATQWHDEADLQAGEKGRLHGELELARAEAAQWHDEADLQAGENGRLHGELELVRAEAAQWHDEADLQAGEKGQLHGKLEHALAEAQLWHDEADLQSAQRTALQDQMHRLSLALNEREASICWRVMNWIRRRTRL